MLANRPALIVLATLSGLLLVEASLQLLLPRPIPPFEYDALLGWNVKLHFTGDERSAESSTVIRTNGQRMRESKDFPVETEAYRIAVVGDSQVWGHGVDEEQRMTELLEAKLGPGFEVLNFGVAGYGSGQNLLRIQKDVLALRPDMVIVGFFLNDLVELRNDSSQGIPKPRFVLRSGTLRLTGVPVERDEGWGEHPFELELPRLLRSAVERTVDGWKAPQLGPGFFAAHLQPFQEHERRWLDRSLEINDLIYARMRALTGGEGIEFAVIELPFKEYFLSDRVLQRELGVSRAQLDFDRVRARFAKLAERLDFLYVDPYPLFEQRGALGNFFDEGPHYNARGHETVALALHEALLRSGLLPDPGPLW